MRQGGAAMLMPIIRATHKRAGSTHEDALAKTVGPDTIKASREGEMREEVKEEASEQEYRAPEDE
jgi:hypothetical protein